MGRILCYVLMRLGGWKYVGGVPTEKKYIVISVPHTSMWDFVWGKFAFGSKKVNPVIFIKKESFFFPLGILLRWLNAKPVNRKSATGLVEEIIEYFNKSDELKVCITPEGTRRKVKRWKKGFYYIAEKAKIPIYLGLIDYGNKVMTIGERFVPTGNINEDMQYIKSYYQKHNPQPKYKDCFTFDIA